MIVIRTDKASEMQVMETLKLLSLPPKKKKDLLRKAAEASRKKSRENAAKQTSPRGKKWKARKRLSGKKSKKKMQQGLARFMGVIGVTDKRSTVGWKVGMTSKIAATHHEGRDQKMSASKAHMLRGKPNYKGPATKAQAKALRKLGFKARINGRKRTASIRWVTENLKLGQAGAIIRFLKKIKETQSWTIPTEKRPFVQVDTDAVNKIFRDALTPNRSS
ncbi:phage virion morphogenesis protein [uncultured Vibrio sp.]|uniref:phage virion morphogenesis protein n=1 Tax=uncultured Vibrio sp. TaxID=114054 RepID=UPI0025FBB5E8|nr:phage virion morphogenesis protein [uncultured Vibrio sp.]